MNFKKVFSAALIASSIAATGFANAQQFPDFRVNPLAYGGTNIFTADNINGGYNEVITFGAGTFAVSLLFTAAQFRANEATTAVGGTGLAGAAGDPEYGLYALFNGIGTFTTNTTTGRTDFVITPGGSLMVYIDPGALGGGIGAPANTTFVAPINGSTPYSTVNSSDDVLLATGAALTGNGNVNCTGSNNCGSFGQTTSFNLTAAGMNYFIAPNPFYSISLQTGQFNGFPVTAGTTQKLTGSLDVSFQQVPEPSAIALFGIALLGCVGIARRRKS